MICLREVISKTEVRSLYCRSCGILCFSSFNVILSFNIVCDFQVWVRIKIQIRQNSEIISHLKQSSRLNNDATYGMSREYMTFSNLYIVCCMNT